MTLSAEFPILQDKVEITDSSPETADNTLEMQHKYTTAKAIELVTEALRVSAGLSRLTDRAKELERDLRNAIEETEHADSNAV